MANIGNVSALLGGAFTPRGVSTSQARKAPNLKGGTFVPKNATFSGPASKPLDIDLGLSQVSPGPMDLGSDGSITEAKTSKGTELTTGQALGVGVVGEALNLAGDLIDIRQNEKDVMTDMQSRYGLAMDQIATDRSLRSVAQTSAKVREVVQMINMINRQGNTGGLQRQQFIENPMTRGLV